jgi:hypothetical protein
MVHSPRAAGKLVKSLLFLIMHLGIARVINLETLAHMLATKGILQPVTTTRRVEMTKNGRIQNWNVTSKIAGTRISGTQTLS